MRLITFALLLMPLIACSYLGGASSGAITDRAVAGQTANLADFAVTTTPQVTGVKRFGVNLGNWTFWGAEQLASNVLKNPGFEGLLDRALVIVKRADQQGFADDTSWLGRPDGFWAGADYEVRSGVSAGTRGKLLTSRLAGLDGLPEFTPQSPAPTLNPGDVIALTRIADDALPTQWWYPPESNGYVIPVSTDKRTNSPGLRSLALRPIAGHSPIEVISYLDTLGERAGKLLSVTGTWRLSFWSKACGGTTSLTVDFKRAGTPSFLRKTITPSADWGETTFDFMPNDHGAPGALELHFSASSTSGCVLLDDVELGSTLDHALPFRTEVVTKLRELQPGYLRDWQGQLGDTFTNRVASPFARRASRYRPGDAVDYGYSLPDLLDLCKAVGAAPWIIIPPTFGDEECRALGGYLAKRGGFKEIVVEFGNENWNGMFRPAGIADPVAHGETANRAFKLISETAGTGFTLRKVVNGQHANPEYALRFAQYATESDTLAVAPYFQYSLDTGTPREQWLNQLFTVDQAPLQTIARAMPKLGKSLAIYEINLHTTEGSATSAEREPLTVGAAAGSAVAKVMLDALSQGARQQCVYTFSGYDTWLANYSGFAKLWGVTRDLTDGGRWRPAGLTLVALNQAISGDLMQSHKLSSVDAELYAFQTSGVWSAAVVSTSATAQTVSISFPPSHVTRMPAQILRVQATAPWATNETTREIIVVKETMTANGNTFNIRLPAYGFVVLLPKEKGNAK